jgi:hypothetical protein
LTLKLFAYKPTAGSYTTGVDCFYMLPLDGWREIVAVQRVSQYEIIIDDAIDDELRHGFADESGGELGNTLVARGDPIMLVPGKAQRLYFVLEQIAVSNDISWVIGDSALVRVWYRPRRLTV